MFMSVLREGDGTTLVRRGDNRQAVSLAEALCVIKDDNYRSTSSVKPRALSRHERLHLSRPVCKNTQVHCGWEEPGSSILQLRAVSVGQALWMV